MHPDPGQEAARMAKGPHAAAMRWTRVLGAASGQARVPTSEGTCTSCWGPGAGREPGTRHDDRRQVTSTQMGILPPIWVCHTEAHVMSVHPDSKSQPKARNFQRKSKTS